MCGVVCARVIKWESFEKPKKIVLTNSGIHDIIDSVKMAKPITTTNSSSVEIN